MNTWAVEVDGRLIYVEDFLFVLVEQVFRLKPVGDEFLCVIRKISSRARHASTDQIVSMKESIEPA